MYIIPVSEFNVKPVMSCIQNILYIYLVLCLYNSRIRKLREKVSTISYVSYLAIQH